MYSIKPIEKGNAQVINEVCLPITPALTLFRYEAVANYYSEEPQHIYLKQHEGDDRCLFEQVFRLRLWVPNKIAYAWIIYSNHREWLSEDGGTKGLIIRNIVWERNLDSALVKNTPKSDKKILLTKWPQLKLNNIYLNPELSAGLIDTLLEGDKLLSNGITLTERLSETERPEWRDIEIRRLYYWGNVQALWTPDMENKALERYSMLLIDQLETYINGDVGSIYQMNLDYIYPPEEYKRFVYGGD